MTGGDGTIHIHQLQWLLRTTIEASAVQLVSLLVILLQILY